MATLLNADVRLIVEVVLMGMALGMTVMLSVSGQFGLAGGLAMALLRHIERPARLDDG